MEFINHQVNTARFPSASGPRASPSLLNLRVYMKSLEKEADNRFQTAAEFTGALTGLLDAARASVTPSSRGSRSSGGRGAVPDLESACSRASVRTAGGLVQAHLFRPGYRCFPLVAAAVLILTR